MWYMVESKLFHKAFVQQDRCKLIRRSAIDAVSGKAVDVVTHGKHMLIGQLVKASPLRDYITYELVVLLDRALLPGLVRITVVHTRTQDSVIIHLYEMRILKLCPVIREDYPEQFAKQLAAELGLEHVECLFDIDLALLLEEIYEHRMTAAEIYR